MDWIIFGYGVRLFCGYIMYRDFCSTELVTLLVINANINDMFFNYIF